MSIIFLYLNMLTTKEILLKLKEIKPKLKEEFSVKEIGIFGSYSNNSYSEESDIDILIELEKPIGWKFFTLELYLNKLFDKKIDLVTKNALKKQISENILNQVKYV